MPQVFARVVDTAAHTRSCYYCCSLQTRQGLIVAVDPADTEEEVMKGRVTFALNTHREICTLHKVLRYFLLQTIHSVRVSDDADAVCLLAT
jgi:exosome complex RNA-binding protein Rrp42 (RNase PH superfamily)